MYRNLFIVTVLAFVFVQCQNTAKTLTVVVENPTMLAFTDAPVQIPQSEIEKHLGKVNPANLIVFMDSTELPSQWLEAEQSLLVLVNLEPVASANIDVKKRAKNQLKAEYAKRTQAELSVKEGGEWKWITKKNGTEQFEYLGGEFKNTDYLKVPKQHTDHSFYIRYEGPGWESDKVGYRFYLDWRNAVDIFGKYVSEPVLQNVGLDGFESYHDSAAWGMDVFKVAESLGIGSIGYWNGQKAVRVATTDSVECRIAVNGNLKSVIDTRYFGWEMLDSKADLTSTISIVAGSRLTRQDLALSAGNPLLCTGIIKHDGINPITNVDDATSQWVYLATYGMQSLAGDSLGLAVMVERQYVKEVTADSLNQIVILQPINGKATYYYLAAWQQEPNGITNSQQFMDYLNQLTTMFNNPLKVSYK